MTRLVVVPAGTPRTTYDEVGVYGHALGAARWLAHYQQAVHAYTDDPQAVSGWEEVYGPDYPYTANDVPVLANGVCRCRWVNSAIAVDRYVPGAGYLEQGRCTFYADDVLAGWPWVQLVGLTAATVVEWTPDRAVVKINMSGLAGGNTYRGEVYVILQRGWAGPRLEVYPSPQQGRALGAQVRWSPYLTDLQFVATGDAAANGMAHANDSATWAGQVLGLQGEPWAVYAGNWRGVYAGVVFANMRAGEVVRTYDDFNAYAAVRKAVAISADQVATAAVAGWVSARLGFLQPAARLLEAEAYRFVGGGSTATQVADAAAGGGQAVNDTQTTNAHTTVTATMAALRLPQGRYAVWVRARGTTGGDTGTLALASPGATYLRSNNPVTAGTVYAWLYLGEVENSAGTLNISAWRSGGTGTTGINVDRVAVAPTQYRLAGQQTYDGARDVALANLYDSRAEPALVRR